MSPGAPDGQAVVLDVAQLEALLADEADRRQLHREAQPVVIATTTTDETQIVVVEEEEALKLQPRRRTGRKCRPGHR